MLQGDLQEEKMVQWIMLRIKTEAVSGSDPKLDR